jgi:hypothetical protein
MKKTGFWSLYVSAYAFAVGVPLLTFPALVPFVSFTENDEVWVRISAMCFIAFAYFNLVIYRERYPSIIRANIVNQGMFAVMMLYLISRYENPALYVVAGIVFVGLAGSILTYRAERPSYVERPIVKMLRTSFWNGYVAAYTFVYGLGTLFPFQVLVPILRFPRPDGFWVRTAGVCFFALSYFNVVAWRDRGAPAIILGILTVRIWFIVILTTLVLGGAPLQLIPINLVVCIGVVGTLLRFRAERALPRSVQVR